MIFYPLLTIVVKFRKITIKKQQKEGSQINDFEKQESHILKYLDFKQSQFKYEIVLFSEFPPLIKKGRLFRFITPFNFFIILL